MFLTQNEGKKMKYLVNFGTNSETYDSIEWLDDYIANHLQYGEDFETEKQKFIDNQIEEISE